MKIKILIVEDELLIAEDLSMKLAKMNYSVTGIVDNAQDALRMVHVNIPDLILMDIRLKGEVDGIELSRKIREVINLPIIFLSSLDDTETVERAKESLPQAYLLKPFKPRELDIAIELAISQMSREKAITYNMLDDSRNGQENGQEDHGLHGSDDQRMREKDQKLQQKQKTFLQDDRIFIKEDFTFNKILVKDICYLMADGSYTVIVTKERSYTLSDILNNFQKKTPFRDFVRCHRTWLVNTDFIESFRGNHVIVNNKEVPIGKTYREDFKKRFYFL